MYKMIWICIYLFRARRDKMGGASKT